MGTPNRRDAAHSFRFRLPNPPTVFVGRSTEADRLERLVSAGCLAVVVGLGGLGKSALVQQVLHRRFPKRCDRAIVVRARKLDDFDQLGLDILGALTQRTPLEEGSDTSNDIAAAVLDVAERQGRLVVLEDLHHLARSDAERWLQVLAGYARNSCWVATTRLRPTSLGVQELVVELGPLSEDASRELGRACRDDAAAAELDALVEAGKGSPFRIRHLAATGATPFAARDLLSGLPEETVRHLAMLSLLEEPVRDGTLGASAETHRELEQRGMIVAAAETHHLHVAVVDHLVGHHTGTERRRAREDAAQALGVAPLARAQLDAFRLLLLQKSFDPSMKLLEGYRAWIRGGLGPRLWKLLSREGDPRFHEMKLRVALDVDSQTSLRWLVTRAAPDSREQRILWVHGLLRSGRPKRAMEELAPIAKDAPNELSVQLLYAHALCDAGYPQRSLEVLRALEPATRLERARRDLHLAKALFHAGDSRGSADRLERVKRDIEKLPAEAAKALSGERRGLLLQLGLRNEIADEPREERGFGVQALILHGFRLAASGRFLHSSRILERITSNSDLPVGSRMLARVTHAILCVPRGEFSGLDVMARDMVHEAEQLGNATLYHWAYMVERLVNLGRAHERPAPAWAESIPSPTGIPDRYLRALRAVHAVRRGEAVAECDIPKAQDGDGPLVECVCQLTEAIVLLHRGEAERAAFLAAHVTRKTVRENYPFFEGEALLIRVYADLTLGRSLELARSVEELSNLATIHRSRRYEILARLAGSALEEEPDVPMLLASLGNDSAPTAGRVAACLLGGPKSPDALDGLLIEGLRSRWRTCVRALVDGETPSWVFDPSSRAVYLPGRTVRASPLAMRILVGLFGAGGNATLAEVASIGWEIDDYHQLRDSKRVHVAIRRLRSRIEEEPSAPRFLLTTNGGYGFSEEDPPGMVRRA